MKAENAKGRAPFPRRRPFPVGHSLSCYAAVGGYKIRKLFFKKILFAVSLGYGPNRIKRNFGTLLVEDVYPLKGHQQDYLNVVYLHGFHPPSLGLLSF